MKKVIVLFLLLQFAAGFAMHGEIRLPAMAESCGDTIPLGIFTRYYVPNYCESIILLNAPESNSQFTYNAKINITTASNYSVDLPNNEIVMKAGSSIVLKPHTHIKNGSLYLARIEPCEDCNAGITFPAFFTPNADTYNDVWKISWGKQYQNAPVYIFDRFGKLIKTLVTENDFWDGKYNGEHIFSNDYWFKFRYLDCDGKEREFKSHFSLKR